MDDEIYSIAYETGKLLALAGFTIVNGGYGRTMLAAAKGAFEAGGKTIGVTCSAFKRGKTNEYITREIITSTLDERLNTLIELGQGYIVLPGSTGTLLELAKVWELKNKSFIPESKPIILIGEFWKLLVDLVAKEDPASCRHIKLAAEPKELKDFLFSDFMKNIGAKC